MHLRPLDKIVEHALKNDKHYEYVKLWNALVAKGAILNVHKKDYHNLSPNNYKEPQRSYVQSIKRNPPNLIKSVRNLLQESNLLRRQLEELKKQNKILSTPYNNANYIANALVLIAGASKYTSLSNLPGTLKDIKRCHDLFGNFYHYNVECTYDKNNPSTESLTLKELNSFIQKGYMKLAKNHKNKKDKYDALIFIWAGHGGDRTLIPSDTTYDNNKKLYKNTKSIHHVKNKFDGNNAHFFIDKPKIIIKAACRGGQQGKGVESRTTDKAYVSPDKDFVFIYANTQFKTIRDSMGSGLGSYFTEKLYEVLKHNFWRTQEIGAIIMRLNNRVQEESEGEECVQGVTTKTKPIFFRKNNNTNTQFMDNEDEETKEDE